MKKIKINPTNSQISQYTTMRKNNCICRNTNLRFNKIVIATDSDLDG